MSLHPQAEAGFARAAAAYERGRPGYPAAAVGWLAERLHLGPGKLLLDLGAGTGKLTRQLLPYGARVVAVEPVAEMAELLRASCPGVEVLSSTVAETGLPSGSVDAASAGQSFHWFDNPESLREIHRILRPRGRLGLVWNRRDPSSPLWHATSELIRPYRQGAPDASRGEWRRALEESGLFGPLESRAFTHRQHAGPELLADRVLSTSFVATLDPGRQAEIRQRLMDLAREHQAAPGRPLSLPYRTEVFACSAC